MSCSRRISSRWVRDKVCLAEVARNNWLVNTGEAIGITSTLSGWRINSMVPGDRVKITVAPKGFGSENKGGIKMLVPADGLEGVKKAVMEIILHASMNPCPPMVVGIGIGGTMDRAAVMSKIALTRSINSHNPMPEYAKLEDDLLELINETGIGPQLGGTTSCLGVNIEWGPTHIAGLPVAVTICCRACRHKTRTL